MADDPNRRVLDSPALVEVLHEGTWYAGTLREWARWDAACWRGLCTWQVAPGRQFHKWVLADRVRPR